MRRHLHRYLVTAFLLLAACAPSGRFLVNPQAINIGTLQTVFFGTTRSLDGEGVYSSGRSHDVNYGQYQVSVPPNHQAGAIEWPTNNPDPRKFFLLAKDIQFPSAQDFSKELGKTFQALPTSQRVAVVYVHGFNTRFSEGIYRLAQLNHDYKLPGVAVHYSWPSSANTFGYSHDRDSMLFARDGLEELLKTVKKAGANQIILIGHSMGALLVMETVRQVTLNNRYDLKRSELGVILISPDIDVDVFLQQTARIDTLPNPFFIYTSQSDRPLRLSGLLSGQKERLGRVSDLTDLSHLKITLVEIGAFEDGGSGHFLVSSSSTLIKVMSQLRNIDKAIGPGIPVASGILSGTVVKVENATRIVLIADEG